MKLFLFLIVLTQLFSCRHNNQILGTAKPIFQFNPYSEYFNQVRYSKLGKSILHQIYQKEFNLGNLDKLLNFPVNSLSEKSFVKLVFISAERDQLFYVPVESSPEWIIENLNFPRLNLDKLIWINKKLKVGQVTFLVATSLSDVLMNEKNFKQSRKVLSDVDYYKINSLSRFQSIEINVLPKSSQPQFVEVEEVVKMGNFCDRGRESGKGDICRCRYTISKPSTLFTDFKKLNTIPRFNVSFDGEEKIEQSGNVWKYDFQNFDNKISFEIDLVKGLTIEKMLIGRPLNSECPSNPEVATIVTEKFLYDLELTIYGVSIDEFDYGELVSEI